MQLWPSTALWRAISVEYHFLACVCGIAPLYDVYLGRNSALWHASGAECRFTTCLLSCVALWHASWAERLFMVYVWA